MPKDGGAARAIQAVGSVGAMCICGAPDHAGGRDASERALPLAAPGSPDPNRGEDGLSIGR